MQILSSLLLVSALAVGFVDANPTKTFKHIARHQGSDSSSVTKTTKSCDSNQFFWESRSLCLTNGGPKSTPTPPSGIDCPLSWFFSHDEGCCLPRVKPKPTSTTPSCSKKGYSWFPSLQCCSQETPPSTTSSVPSAKPKSKKDDKNKGNQKDKKDDEKNKWHDHTKVKRNFEQWDASFCPTGLTTCPVISHGVLTGDFECIDTLSDLTSCGGCTSLGQGTDCSTIPGASCLGGTCSVVA